MRKLENTEPFRIGLTGGIASGKSLIANYFEELGVPVIDTDVIARELVEPGSPALNEIRQMFGDRVIAVDGGLNRAALRTIVFADEGERRKLEGLLHPLIREETMRQSASAGGRYQIIVVPLLAESPMRESMDRILVVDVPKALQLERLLARDAENKAQAERIIASQASREERLAIADDVINNDGSLELARQRVAELHRRYERLAALR
ncbi:dephospho-CoA kinase [Woeseia oceani]|uniref:Dephospho-CoA kinase n=1 Tax=Woeseia oceani TaxID=1548547 RepID=A0A193LIF4_9GAMM|nr:dephospho-CoA kinase [Woeseia oceani]ANO52174.1 dephospho-CoA kinase [Woeseia oceani]